MFEACYGRAVFEVSESAVENLATIDQFAGYCPFELNSVPYPDPSKQTHGFRPKYQRSAHYNGA